ncbi:VanZ family protein [Microbacterium marinum]|uniref:VanZ family protein n=1 Tax=Microbacterium marinum TaxID=421115 RepID=A0A7W7BQT0_9MICO|nr:VanZ family protein [Microbacterium marinum]MBB4666151.1 VanZ family protein [Microbacterium marinum]
MPSPTEIAPRPPDPRARADRMPQLLLLAYLVALALTAFWPTPVDAGLAPLLETVTRHFPVVTHARVEFAANIALFLPIGVLLPLMMPRTLVLPVALVATVAIESTQALLLDARVPSVLDIIANTTGACLGLLILEAFRARRRRT